MCVFSLKYLLYYNYIIAQSDEICSVYEYIMLVILLHIPLYVKRYRGYNNDVIIVKNNIIRDENKIG